MKSIEEVMEIYPTLNVFGLGISNLDNGSGADRAKKLAKNRDELFNSKGLILKCQAWVVENLNSIKSINKKHSSYGLKHLAERDLGEYVANGVFIAAMLLEGYQMQNIGFNARFNVSEKSKAFFGVAAA